MDVAAAPPQSFGRRAVPVTASARTQAPAHEGWLRPALPVAGCVLLVSAMAHVRVPLLPELGDDLSMSPSALGVAVTLFGLGRLAMDLPAGSLADRFRPMRLMATSALVMGAGSALLAAAGHAAVVMVAFLLLGAASATANTTGMTTLTGSAPAERRGSAMALYSGCLLAGQAHRDWIERERPEQPMSTCGCPPSGVAPTT